MAKAQLNFGELGVGGSKIECGTATGTTTVTVNLSQISDPDFLMITSDRNDNDWSALYWKSGTLGATYSENGAFSFASTSQMNWYANSVAKVSDTQFTVSNIGTSGVTFKWFAVKQS